MEWHRFTLATILVPPSFSYYAADRNTAVIEDYVSVLYLEEAHNINSRVCQGIITVEKRRGKEEEKPPGREYKKQEDGIIRGEQEKFASEKKSCRLSV